MYDNKLFIKEYALMRNTNRDQNRLCIVVLGLFFTFLFQSDAYAARSFIFAGDDSASTPVNSAVSIPVLINDYSNNTPLHMEIEPVWGPVHGTVNLSPDGEAIYVPNEGFTGNDVFWYEIRDNRGDLDQAKVFITVDSSKPTAVADRVVTGNNSIASIPAATLLINDYDPDGDPLTILDVQPVSLVNEYNQEEVMTQGIVSCEDAQCTNIIYQSPSAGSVNFDFFIYTITDGTDTDEAVVAVDISNVTLNARGDGVETSTEKPVYIHVLDNDSGSSLSIVSSTHGAHGIANINIGNDSITYEPFLYYTGTDTFTYTVEDGSGNTMTAAVTVIVEPPLSSSSYDFTVNPGPITLFSTSHAKGITLTNTGWYDWFIDSLSIGGENSVDFHTWDDRCSNTVLAPTESCTFSVVFAPTSAGLKYAQLAVITGEEDRVFYVDLYGVGTSQLPFSDISSSHWAADNIHTIYNNGITSGYPDGTYGPAKEVTRAELAVYIIRALEGEPSEACTASLFTDVPSGHWACKYIQRLVELGIINSDPTEPFKPADAATRVRMAEHIVRALEGVPAEGCTEHLFSDVPSDFWACKYIKRLVELGIANGYPDNTFRPWYPVTRAEMSVFIARAFLAFIPRTIEYNLTVTKTGTGSGTVTASPGTLTWENNVGTALYESGTTVTLTAAASQGSTFNGWGGACSGTGNCQVAMNSQMNVTANFAANPNQVTLTVTKIGSGYGTVFTDTGSLVWSGNTGTATYTSGTVVTLSAEASAGSTFSGWGGDFDCTDGMVTMNGQKNCTATFSLSNGSDIDYVSIPMTYNGVYYGGSIYGESIGPKPAQKFYKVTRPSACTTNIQFQLAGNISNYVNANMLISDGEFGTPADALEDYQYMLNTHGYLNPQEVFYNNKTYWFYFYGNPASEVVDIDSPNDSVYYIEIVNEENELGYFNIKSYCW